MKRTRGETEIHRSWLLWGTRLKPSDAWGPAYIDFFERTERIKKLSEKQSLPNTGTYMAEEEEGFKITFVFIFPTILLSFPLLPLTASQSPPFQQNPSTFLSFFITSLFLSQISYPLAPSPSLQVFVHMFNSLSENISRTLDCWPQKD